MSEVADITSDSPKRGRGRPRKQPDSPAGEGGTAADTRKRAVRVRASVLHGALKDVAGIVGPTTIPILAHVLLNAGDGRIELTCSNLELWATRDCASDDRDGPGSAEWVQSIRPFSITLPAKPLQKLLAEFDGDAMVTITAPDDMTEDYGGQAVIACGRARFKLHCLPPAEFPAAPPVSVHSYFEMPCSALADALAAVDHAISTEETRYYLNGVFVHGQQEAGEPMDLRFAATDGHRLARLKIDLPDGAASWPATIVHRETVGLLGKLLAAAAKTEEKDAPGPVALVESADEAPGHRFRISMPAADGGDITIVAKAVDGTYPDYNRVIPAGFASSAVIARDELAHAIKRVAVLASEKTRAVAACFREDELELTVTTPALGEARESIPCLYEGPEFSVGLNGDYWRQALAALATDDVLMGFSEDRAGPVLVRASGPDDADRLVQVLMPVRIGA